ncbi:hypothetical protein VTN00DRAFT_6418 [Thermoascus crustaceus]|uniref:uncharacterized protein n=1 Tax=Thermoascus crustaceus TaxID=5088 RepID=UPI003742F11E
MVTSSISLSRISIPKQTTLQHMDPVWIKRPGMIVIGNIAAPRHPHLTEVLTALACPRALDSYVSPRCLAASAPAPRPWLSAFLPRGLAPLARCRHTCFADWVWCALRAARDRLALLSEISPGPLWARYIRPLSRRGARIITSFSSSFKS